MVQRTRRYALSVIRLYTTLSKSTVAQVLGRQLLRSATSVGAHYREACRAKSAADFVSKYFPGFYNIIPNGIDVERFSPQAPSLPQYQDDKLNILFLGRLEKRKGVGYLLRAYRIVKRVFPQVRLIIAGEGKLKEDYQRFVEKASLPDVVFTGYVPDQEIPSLYQSAHIFCAPATGKESFGIVLLEAMALAKPVVATAIEGYSRVVTSGEEGILVEPQNEDALALALLQLLKDEALRQEMGAKGRIKALNHSWEHVSRRVMDYYQGLVREKAPSIP